MLARAAILSLVILIASSLDVALAASMSSRWTFLDPTEEIHGRALTRGAKQSLLVECQEPEQTHRQLTTLAQDASVEMELPMPDGTTAHFSLHDTTAQAMEEGLRRKLPELRTFSGTCTECGMVTAHVVVGDEYALHVQYLAPSWVGYADPVRPKEHQHHRRLFHLYVQRGKT
jgi:hypothetical protein